MFNRSCGLISSNKIYVLDAKKVANVSLSQFVDINELRQLSVCRSLFTKFFLHDDEIASQVADSMSVSGYFIDTKMKIFSVYILNSKKKVIEK